MKRILIIDDEPNARLNFRLALEVEGYHAAEAASGAMAMEKLPAGQFDLAILDLRMPGVGGLELLEWMRKEGIATPVIIVTAYGSVPDALNLLGVLAELGGDYRNARKCYGRAIRAKHDHPAAQQNMRRLFELDHFGATEEPLNLGD